MITESLPEMVIQQNSQGYRYSIEPFLLADFADLTPGFKILDVGTGCGIISLLLARKEPGLAITAIEIQKSLFELAVENVFQNGLSHQIKIIHGNFIDQTQIFSPGTFDLILSNPPFRKINTGRTNPRHGKAIARHEITINLRSLLDQSKRLLTTDGRLNLSYPPNRLSEVIFEMEAREIYPHRLRFIHGYRGAEAKIFIVEGIKGRRVDCSIVDPLYIYRKKGVYTKEMENIYDSFNYPGRSDDLEKK